MRIELSMPVNVISVHGRHRRAGARPRVEARIGRIADSVTARRTAAARLRAQQVIQTRSGGELTFHIDSLYPLLYRLEEREWIKGSWVEKPDERRRRIYRLTAEGRRVLADQQRAFDTFVAAVRRVIGDAHA
jgi:PadR family transcriptional regulator, regulatory protein PadR